MANIRSLTDGFQDASDFQQCADLLLNALLDELEAAMEGGLSPHVSVIRGTLHLRGISSYQGVAIVERGGESTPEDALRPSETAWRLMSEHLAPISVNVLTAQAEVISTGEQLAAETIRLDPTMTMDRLGERDVTHMLVLPVTVAQRELKGFVSLELRCAALVPDLPWKETISELDTVMAIGSQYVISLPAPRLDRTTDDAFPISSKWLNEQRSLLQVFASRTRTMLITGRTGTGKSKLAEWIHRNSSQRSGPFVNNSLSALPNDTGLQNLFGWKKGAFTDATSDYVGWAAQAANGTLFLDDIDTLSRVQQDGLLEFLDTGEYPVAGGNKEKLDNVRMILATNADLPAMIDQESFREDLYYRINVCVVDIPPLAERVDEIPEWAIYFAERESAQLTNEAISFLASQSFPGNVRDVRTCIERATDLAASEGETGSQVVIDAAHCKRALEATRPVAANDPVTQLHRAAQAILDSTPEGILNDASKGILGDMIWYVAVQKFGDTLLGHDRQSRKQVAALLGKDKALKSNNYGSDLKDALRRLRQFYHSHGSETPNDMERILRPRESSKSEPG